jgi:molybdenum cofactor synthesis domain-containing protein
MFINQVRAAILVIGNEILSGRTQDQNVKFIAEHLSDCGISLMEVRIVQDIKKTIIESVNSLRNKYDFVFTTGGIGPTHDDITAESIAEAFSVQLELREEAEEAIRNRYAEAKVEFRAESLRMAMIPQGAELIQNAVSGAPGFRIDNVFVFAGVPHIMQSMFLSIIPSIKTEQKFYSSTLTLKVGESSIAEICRAIQLEDETVQIGSYPFEENGKWATKLVIRDLNQNKVKIVADKLKKKLQESQIPYE